MGLKYYKLYIDDADETTGVAAVALVDKPAIQRNFIVFKDGRMRSRKHIKLGKDGKTIYGVLMLANVPIYRNTDGEEWYAIFDKETIRKVMVRASKNGTLNRVNLNHDPSQPVEGVYYIGGYQVDQSIGLVPHFGDNITDGSWIGIYHCENPDIISQIRKGTFNGFSIEGEFIHKQVQLL